MGFFLLERALDEAVNVPPGVVPLIASFLELRGVSPVPSVTGNTGSILFSSVSAMSSLFTVQYLVLVAGRILHLKRWSNVVVGNIIGMTEGITYIITARSPATLAQYAEIMKVLCFIPRDTAMIGFGWMIPSNFAMGYPLSMSCWNVRLLCFPSRSRHCEISDVRSIGIPSILIWILLE